MQARQKSGSEAGRQEAPTANAALEAAPALDVMHNREVAFAAPGWLDAEDPVQAFMARYATVIAPGWHSLARRTLAALMLAAKDNSERRQALNQICVFGLTTSLSFVVCSHIDVVVDGIVRKTRVRSLGICEECGKPARLRELGEDERAILCPHCAAPALLQYDIWQLQQSIRFLRAVNAPVGVSQIPSLLRPSFVEAALQHRDEEEEAEQVRMSPTHFLCWAEEWGQVADHIVIPRRHTFAVIQNGKGNQ